MSRKPGPAGNITPKVLHVITSRPGEIVYLDEIVEATGFEKGQIQSAITNYKRRHDQENEVEVKMNGQAWRYRPFKAHNSNQESSLTWEDPPFVASDPPAPTPPPAPAPTPAAVVASQLGSSGSRTIHVYEELAVTDEGAVILRDDRGAIYKATIERL